MTLVFSDFRRSFLFLTLIVVSQTSAKPGNSASTPVGSSPTNPCQNVYFSLHAGTPNKKIGTLIQEMKKQLMHDRNDVSIIKARNNTSCKGMFTINYHFPFHLFGIVTQIKEVQRILILSGKYTETLLREINETLLEMQNDIASIKENKTLIESRHTCTEGKRQMEKLVMLSTKSYDSRANPFMSSNS